MAKWSGRGIPPTRRKLHAWRVKKEKARQEELAERKEMDNWLEDSARRSGIDTMLTEG